MGVDEVVERSTVKFERALDISGVKSLLRYVAERVPCEVSYAVECFEALVHSSCGNGVITNQHGSFKFSGTFRILGGTSFAGFNCSSDAYLGAGALNFLAIPGYSLSEHRKEEVEVWDNVRAGIEKYFKEMKDAHK